MLDCYINCVIFSGVKLGLEKSHLAGDSWIQGGTILLGQDGNIVYQVPAIFKQTTILANYQFFLALYSKLRVLKFFMAKAITTRTSRELALGQ